MPTGSVRTNLDVERFGTGDRGLVFHHGGVAWRRNKAAGAFKTTSETAHVDAKTYAGWWPNENDTIRSAMSRVWASPADTQSATVGD